MGVGTSVVIGGQILAITGVAFTPCITPRTIISRLGIIIARRIELFYIGEIKEGTLPFWVAYSHTLSLFAGQYTGPAVSMSCHQDEPHVRIIAIQGIEGSEILPNS